MRRVTFTGLIVAVAVVLTGCGTATSPRTTGTSPRTTGTSPRASSTTPRAGTTTSRAAGSRTERPPTCYPVILTENSGNGPTYHVRICDALPRPRPGHEWQLIVDGGRLGNQAVIFGQQVPR